MFSIRSQARVTDTYTELSFRHRDTWRSFASEGPLSDVVSMIILLGDERCGPVLGFTALAPGVDCPLGPAHGHCSDNFRVSLRGDLTMGREIYRPGGFRFQEGWKTYPTNNNSCGPEGGWEMELFADQRGMRASAVAGGPELEMLLVEGGRMLAGMFGLDDLVAEPPPDICGPSALATTLGAADNSGKRNGSFADASAWRSVDDATTVAAGLLGEPTCGPVVLLADTAPNQIAFPAARFDTEVFRLIVAGSCAIGDRTYELGDMRLQRSGTDAPPVIAGDDGVQQVIVLGDRRCARPTVGGTTWLHALVAELSDELASRPVVEPPPRVFATL